MQGAAEALAKLPPTASGGAAERTIPRVTEALTKVPHPAPTAAPTRSVRAETLIPTRITDLVHKAVERQTEHVRAQRAPETTRPDSKASVGSGGDSLAEALARIEAAAAGARIKSKAGRSNKRPDGSEGSQD